MPAKLIAGEPAAIRRSFSSNHSYPGKTLADERQAYREALLRMRSAASIATSVPLVGKGD
jgi:hypothetical protein